MIDVVAAEKIIKNYFLNLCTENVGLDQLSGKMLAESIVSLRKQPPFDRVAMDGVAISFSALENTEDAKFYDFFIENIQKAGVKVCSLIDKKNAIEVMTGAALPLGTDTVIPYEWLSLSDGQATLSFEQKTKVKRWQNIHFSGSDYDVNTVLLPAGKKLIAPLVSIIASQGRTTAKVIKLPKVAVVSTGDELVAPGEKCEDWQIWRSNSFAIKAELRLLGFADADVKIYHLADDRKKMFTAFLGFLKKFDIIIVSGGVSMGKFDFVKAVVEDLGMDLHFHKIAQRPGKPMLFATKGSKCFFGLPGNPVSSLICLRRYIVMALEKVLGQRSFLNKVILTERIVFEKPITLFRAVKTKMNEKGQFLATPLKFNGSGDFFSLADSDGFIELPSAEQVYDKGNVYTFFPWQGVF